MYYLKIKKIVFKNWIDIIIKKLEQRWFPVSIKIKKVINLSKSFYQKNKKQTTRKSCERYQKLFVKKSDNIVTSNAKNFPEYEKQRLSEYRKKYHEIRKSFMQ